jgi:hypothetical protein
MCLQKVSRSDVIFLILYVDDILFKKPHIFTLISKVLTVQEFLHKKIRRSNLYIGYRDL